MLMVVACLLSDFYVPGAILSEVWTHEKNMLHMEAQGVVGMVVMEIAHT